MNCYEINTFYQFVTLPHFANLHEPLRERCDALNVRGILLLAREGLNGTLAGTPDAMARARENIARICGLGQIEPKVSFASAPPFLRLRVRLKQEIVKLGVPEADPNRQVGTYVAPSQWNALIRDPDMVVIDARNGFEVAIGSFPGALNPQTAAFSDFPDFVQRTLDPAKHRKVAMFCTGGIRCEKASSYMLATGFDQVFHLKGGILQYLEDVPQEQSLWQGACFVFDQRIAVGHGVTPADVALCHGCRRPLTAEEHAAPQFEVGVSCPHCHATLSLTKKSSARERHRQIALATARGDAHLGPRKAGAFAETA